MNTPHATAIRQVVDEITRLSIANRTRGAIEAILFDRLAPLLEQAEKERDEAAECLRLTRGELDAIKNTPQANEGTNICGHNRYWMSHYGRCMACERDQAEIRAAAAEGELQAARAANADCLKREQKAVAHSSEIESRYYDELAGKFRAQGERDSALAKLAACEATLSLIRAKTIGELHIPEADAILDEIADLCDAHLSQSKGSDHG